MVPGSSMMRVKEETRSLLHELAREQNTTMQDVLQQAVELYRRERIWQAAEAAYAAMRADDQLWEEEQKERALWDGTLMDGIVEASDAEESPLAP